jgi:hypothetical protein
MSEPSSPVRNPNEDNDEPVPVTPEPVTPEPVTPEPVTPEPVTPEPVTPVPQIIRTNPHQNILSGLNLDDDDEINTDTSVSEGEMEEIRERTRARREETRRRREALQGNPLPGPDFGSEDEEDVSVQPRQLDFGSDGSPHCLIPDEIKAMRPTISDHVEFMDIIDGEDKTIKQHLEEVEEEGEVPDNVIFMNQTKNQFVAVTKDQIRKLIFVNGRGDEADVRSGVNYKCKHVIQGYSIRPNNVEYYKPYFDLSSIGFAPGGYVDLNCLLEHLDSDNRVFMIVAPEDPIKIDPVANDLSIATHSYVIKGPKITTNFIDDSITQEPDQEYHSGQLNSAGLVVDMTGAVYCQKGQSATKVFMIPVQLEGTADEASSGSHSPSGSYFDPEEEDYETSRLPPLPPPPPRMPRGGKKTLRKKNLLKKKKNKTKRKKSKKNKKNKKSKK